jgi:hypothetical protein
MNVILTITCLIRADKSQPVLRAVPEVRQQERNVHVGYGVQRDVLHRESAGPDTDELRQVSGLIDTVYGGGFQTGIVCAMIKITYNLSITPCKLNPTEKAKEVFKKFVTARAL